MLLTVGLRAMISGHTSRISWRNLLPGMQRNRISIPGRIHTRLSCFFQYLRDLYFRFIQLCLQATKEADAKLPLEIKSLIWHSPYILISDFEEKAS